MMTSIANMMLAKINMSDLEHVAFNMRDRDKEEIYATRWSNDPEELSEAVMRGGEFAWVAGSNDGTPVAAFGAIPVWDGVWEVWMFATDNWDKVAFDCTKFIKRTVIPSLEKTGAHRLQCRSMAKHTVAHRWLENLGFQKESEMKSLGNLGQDFFLYCWTRPVSHAK